MFVGTRFGNNVTAIVADRDQDDCGGLYRPNGLAYHNGRYIAELFQISKIDNVEANLDKPPKPTVIYKDLPKDEAHGWKFIAGALPADPALFVSRKSALFPKR
jgi:hypothetical protein